MVEVLQSQQSDDRRTLDFSRLSRWGRQEDVEEVWRVARHLEHEGEGRLIGTPIVSGCSRSERLKILTVHESPSTARLGHFQDYENPDKKLCDTPSAGAQTPEVFVDLVSP